MRGWSSGETAGITFLRLRGAFADVDANADADADVDAPASNFIKVTPSA